MLLDGFLVWKNYILEFVLVDAQLAQKKKVARDTVHHCQEDLSEFEVAV